MKRYPIKNRPTTLKEAEELTKKMYDMSVSLYHKDQGHSDLITKFLTRLRSYDEKVFNFMLNEIKRLDPNVFDKNSFIQKVLINRIFLTYLLTISGLTNINVNNAIVCCDNNLDDEVWLNSVFKTVIPVILNNLDI